MSIELVVTLPSLKLMRRKSPSWMAFSSVCIPLYILSAASRFHTGAYSFSMKPANEPARSSHIPVSSHGSSP